MYSDVTTGIQIRGPMAEGNTFFLRLPARKGDQGSQMSTDTTSAIMMKLFHAKIISNPSPSFQCLDRRRWYAAHPLLSFNSPRR